MRLWKCLQLGHYIDYGYVGPLAMPAVCWLRELGNPISAASDAVPNAGRQPHELSGLNPSDNVVASVRQEPRLPLTSRVP
jgi:hypothetical protein